MQGNIQNLSLILSILAVLLGAYCFWQIRSLSKLRSIFFGGSKGIDLEEVIYSLGSEIKDSRQHLDLLQTTLSQLKSDFGFAVQKVGLIRFNPFNDGGGNFSFALALLDAHNTGVIITSIYGREQNRVYTKKIVEGECENQLTDEEIQAIELANSKFQEPKLKQK